MTETVPEIASPDQVIGAIRECAARISKGVTICGNRYAEFLEADQRYDVSYAHAYMEQSGAAHERKYLAELATEKERTDRDVADAAYKYADRTARAIENELRAWQSVNASTRALYQVAGTVER